MFSLFFFFIDPATTEIYTLSLHDALPISRNCSAPLPTWKLQVTRPVPSPVESLVTTALNVPRYPLARSEEHTSELQSLRHLVCRLLLEKKKKNKITQTKTTRHSTQENATQ